MSPSLAAGMLCGGGHPVAAAGVAAGALPSTLLWKFPPGLR
jgi:hypothetical protein